MNNQERKIGIAQEAIRTGDVVAAINLLTGEVISNKIRFLPYGKINLRKKVM